MSIASMTGFAREAGVTGAYQWAWEIKTVNGRGLEIRVRTPSGLDAVGEDARGQILKALTRGQGQLTLALSRTSSTPKLRVNQDVLHSLLAAVGSLSLDHHEQLGDGGHVVEQIGDERCGHVVRQVGDQPPPGR